MSRLAAMSRGPRARGLLVRKLQLVTLNSRSLFPEISC
jgi:hypothetical protein